MTLHALLPKKTTIIVFICIILLSIFAGFIYSDLNYLDINPITLVLLLPLVLTHGDGGYLISDNPVMSIPGLSWLIHIIYSYLLTLVIIGLARLSVGWLTGRPKPMR